MVQYGTKMLKILDLRLLGSICVRVCARAHVCVCVLMRDVKREKEKEMNLVGYKCPEFCCR